MESGRRLKFLEKEDGHRQKKRNFKKSRIKTQYNFLKNSGIYLILFIQPYYSTIGLEILSNNQTNLNTFSIFPKFDTILNKLVNELVEHVENMFLKKY
jgi:hypothetical protein